MRFEAGEMVPWAFDGVDSVAKKLGLERSPLDDFYRRELAYWRRAAVFICKLEDSRRDINFNRRCITSSRDLLNKSRGG